MKHIFWTSRAVTKMTCITLGITSLCAIIPLRTAIAQEEQRLQIDDYKITQEQPGFYGATYISKNNSFRSRSAVSTDNGVTWKNSLTKNPPVVADKLVETNNSRRTPVSSLFDPKTGFFATFVNSIDSEEVDLSISEPKGAMNTYYLRYKVSADAGKSWLFDEPIVQEGNFTPQHPVPGVYVGRNAIAMGDRGCIPIITRAGTILFPTQASILGPGTKLQNPGGGPTYTDVIVLRGKWQKDGHILWTGSTRVQGDPAATTRGIIEPTLAQLKDGRILMVMRGSNGGTLDKEFKLPGYKWFSYSDDDGVTWSKPAPWKYDDGTSFYSPSSMSALFHHSSGRVFWVGNITPDNPKANLPRYPLIFGEVNQENMQLIRATALTVDDVKPGDKDKGRIDISHMSVTEDPQTHEIILTYPRHYNAYKNTEWVTVRIKP